MIKLLPFPKAVLCPLDLRRLGGQLHSVTLAKPYLHSPHVSHSHYPPSTIHRSLFTANRSPFTLH